MRELLAAIPMVSIVIPSSTTDPSNSNNPAVEVTVIRDLSALLSTFTENRRTLNDKVFSMVDTGGGNSPFRYFLGCLHQIFREVS